MPTSLLDDDHRRGLVARIERLRPDSAALWGTMDCGRMLCHLADQLRVALGDLTVEDRSTWMKRNVAIRLLLLLPIRPPRGRIRTSREMLTTEPAEWAADRDALLELVDRFVAAGAEDPEKRRAHPAFGPLDLRQWGRLAAKHFDHHLRQFGV